MIRGCQRRVVYVKNTENALFDEAYFLISEDVSEISDTHPDILTEARRLLCEADVIGEKKRKKRKSVFFFALGAAVATAVYALVGIFAYVF